MNKKKFITAVLIWFLGLPLSIALSYGLRVVGDFHSLGMPELVWFTMHISLYIVSVVAIYISLQGVTLMNKLLTMVTMSLIYAVTYFGVTWFYIIESNVDSM